MDEQNQNTGVEQPATVTQQVEGTQQTETAPAVVAPAIVTQQPADVGRLFNRHAETSAQYQPRTAEDVNQNDIAEVVGAVIHNAMAPIQRQQAEINLQMEITRLRTSHSDFDEYAPNIYQILQDSPEMWNMGNTGKVLDIAYRLAKSADIQDKVPGIVKQARVEAQASRVIKETTLTDKNRASQSSEGEPTIEDSIRAGILADVKKRQASVF